MKRRQTSSQGLNDEGHEALQTLHEEEQLLQEAISFLKEFNPEATITQAKELLRDRSQPHYYDDVHYDVEAWLSW